MSGRRSRYFCGHWSCRSITWRWRIWGFVSSSRCTNNPSNVQGCARVTACSGSGCPDCRTIGAPYWLSLSQKRLSDGTGWDSSSTGAENLRPEIRADPKSTPRFENSFAACRARIRPGRTTDSIGTHSVGIRGRRENRRQVHGAHPKAAFPEPADQPPAPTMTDCDPVASRGWRFC